MMTEFLWPYSWAWCQMGDAEGEGDGEGPREPAPPLCRTPGAATAAADLLLALVHGCVPNMAAVAQLLEMMFYCGTYLTSQPLRVIFLL